MNQNTTELRPNISALSINVNGLNSPNERKDFPWDTPRKTRPYAASKIKLLRKAKNKGISKDTPSNWKK